MLARLVITRQVYPARYTGNSEAGSIDNPRFRPGDVIEVATADPSDLRAGCLSVITTDGRVLPALPSDAVAVAAPVPAFAWKPTWFTRDVTGLARRIRDGREFSLMPILADALQEAGCEDGPVLDYCRSAGPFFRGCWVLDVATGRRDAGGNSLGTVREMRERARALGIRGRSRLRTRLALAVALANA